MDLVTYQCPMCGRKVTTVPSAEVFCPPGPKHYRTPVLMKRVVTPPDQGKRTALP